MEQLQEQAKTFEACGSECFKHLDPQHKNLVVIKKGNQIRTPQRTTILTVFYNHKTHITQT